MTLSMYRQPTCYPSNHCGNHPLLTCGPRLGCLISDLALELQNVPLRLQICLQRFVWVRREIFRDLPVGLQRLQLLFLKAGEAEGIHLSEEARQGAILARPPLTGISILQGTGKAHHARLFWPSFHGQTFRALASPISRCSFQGAKGAASCGVALLEMEIRNFRAGCSAGI